MKIKTLIGLMVLIGLLSSVLIRSGKLLTIFSSTKMKLTSPALTEGGVIPEIYTCRGEDVSPPLVIVDPPANTQSFALILEDSDAPFQTWVHWVMWNISPETLVIIEDDIPLGATVGTTSANDQKYNGPCPPTGTHHYAFKIVALDTTLTLPPEANKSDLETVIKGHVIGEAHLTGVFP